MSLREGSVIEFKDKKRIATGLCIKNEKKAIRIINDLNKEFSLPLNKVTHITDHSLNSGKSRFELAQELNEIINNIEEIAEKIALSDLWDLLKDEDNEKYSLAQITEIYFGPESNSDSRSAMLRVLNNDSIYFDEKGEGNYLPKTQKVVEQILFQKELEEKRIRQKENTIKWLKQIWFSDKTDEKPEGSERVIDNLQNLAVLGNRSEKFSEALQILQEVGINEGEPSENAIALLVKLGIFSEDQNLLLIEHNIPVNFSENLQDEINKINIDPEKLIYQRLDLRSLETITIDDEETMDIDDAISYQSLDDGFCLGIHIADASQFVQSDSLLDREAKNRSTTIYLPEGKIEMLPATLSEDLCSLVEGKDRLAISILVNFSTNCEVIGYEIKESVINVKKRLSYKNCDEIFDHDPLFLRFAKIADRLRSLRVQRGAIIFNLPELKIKIGKQKEIMLSKYKNNSPSQQVVSEFMILANGLVAEFFSKNKLPCIYRYQEEPSSVIDFDANLEQAILMYRQRKLMKKSETGTIPEEHHGLGLKSYTQITSPIRRYSDLIVHRQLKHFLQTGSILYTEENLREILYLSEHSLSIAGIIQRNANRYWLAKYFSSRQSGKVQAMVMDATDDRYIIQLTDFLLELPLFREAGRKLEIGEKIEVIITDVKIRKGFISVRLTRESEQNLSVIGID